MPNEKNFDISVVAIFYSCTLISATAGAALSENQYATEIENLLSRNNNEGLTDLINTLQRFISLSTLESLLDHSRFLNKHSHFIFKGDTIDKYVLVNDFVVVTLVFDSNSRLIGQLSGLRVKITDEDIALKPNQAKTP